MDKRKWSSEEVKEFRNKNIGKSFLYYNKEDTNLFVPKVVGFGWSLNFANPLSWIISAAIIIIIILVGLFS